MKVVCVNTQEYYFKQIEKRLRRLIRGLGYVKKRPIYCSKRNFTKNKFAFQKTEQPSL